MSAETGATKPSVFDDGELYDVVAHDITYGIDFYVALARQAKGPILDIACGTGRILLPCLQAGADGDGLDLFQPMLDRLQCKATALGLRPNLFRADMSDFRLPRRYALIMITFNAFIHNMTQEAQIRCLERCREHLLPGGLLAFDTFFPSLKLIGGTNGTPELEGKTTDPVTGLPILMYDTRTFDRVNQIQHSLTEIVFLDADAKLRKSHQFEFDTRYVFKAEMELLLRVAGFSRWQISGDFDRRPLTQETDAMIVEAWNEDVAARCTLT